MSDKLESPGEAGGAEALVLWLEWFTSIDFNGPYVVGPHTDYLSCFFCGASGFERVKSLPGPAEPHKTTCVYYRAKALVEQACPWIS